MSEGKSQFTVVSINSSGKLRFSFYPNRCCETSHESTRDSNFCLCFVGDLIWRTTFCTNVKGNFSYMKKDRIKFTFATQIVISVLLVIWVKASCWLLQNFFSLSFLFLVSSNVNISSYLWTTNTSWTSFHVEIDENSVLFAVCCWLV